MKRQYTRWFAGTTLGIFFASLLMVCQHGWTQPAGTSTRAVAPAAAATSSTPPAEAEEALGEQLSPQSQQQIKDAIEKFNQSDVAGALELLKATYQANPQMTPPRLILATWFAQLKNQRAVRLSLEMATDETPTDPEAYVLLGGIAYSQGEFTAADLLYRQGEAMLANYTANENRAKRLKIQVLNGKLNVADARGRWDEAQVILGELIKLEGENADLARKVGISFFQKKEDDSARQWLAHSEKLADGKGLPADAILAQLYLSRNDIPKAQASLDAALKANPDRLEVLALSVSMALNQNNLALAWQHAQTLYAKAADDVGAMKTYASVALFRDDFVTAEKVLKETLIKAPNDAEAVNNLALALCDQNDPDKQKQALELAASNVQKQPRNSDFIATFGWTLLKVGDVEKAKQVLQQATASGTVTAATAYYFAVLLNKEGNNDQAKELLTAAVASKQPFIKRKAAQALLDSIGK